jgi:hypothetical protein
MTHPNPNYWQVMYCWNGLSAEQQQRLLKWGNLPYRYKPEGKCPEMATVCVETIDDEAPGPRFYCYPCAVKFLQARQYDWRLANRAAAGLPAN